MKKYAYVLMIFSMLLISMNTSAMSVPTWEEGDWWEYEVKTEGMFPITFDMRFNVTGDENIAINGKTYPCYVLISESTIMGVNQTTTTFISKENLASVKSVTETRMNVMGKETLTETITIYNPPKVDMKFPLEIGAEWTSSGDIIQTEKSDSGSNISKRSTYSQTLKCVGKEEISVLAGRFTAYRIEGTYIQENATTNITIWYSPSIKYYVKMVSKVDTPFTDITTTLSLKKYEVRSGTTNGGGNVLGDANTLLLFMIGIIIVIVVVIVSVIGVAIMRKRKTAAPPQPQQTSYPQYQQYQAQEVQPQQQPQPQPSTASTGYLLCPNCRNTFPDPQTYPTVQCPTCGVVFNR